MDTIFKMDTIYDNVFMVLLYEVLPFYIYFETFWFCLKRLFDFNEFYFLMHYFVNLFNTIVLIPVIKTVLKNPLSQSVDVIENHYIDYIYPMIIGLHTLHLVHHLKYIHYDEIFHHIVTHVFWYGTYYCNSSPIYIIPMIGMSGIPGGITYLMLFLQKFGYIGRMTEKKISMYLNIWVRAPMCIIASTLMYIKNNDELIHQNKSMFDYNMTLFMIFFTFINGVHFMNNIIESYYQHYYKKYF